MGRQAHHHFIPRTYLKRFTIDGRDTSKFWGVSLEQKKTFVTTPKDSCSQRDYYTVDHENPLIVEQWYANEIEPRLSEFLQQIEKNYVLNNKNREGLTLLLATLYLRNPSWRYQMEMSRKHVKEIVHSMSKDIKIKNLAEFDYSQTDLIRSELNLINNTQKVLLAKNYQLCIVEDDEFDVITSDNPFVLSHELGANERFFYGLNTKGIEICVPLNRKQFIIGSNEPLEERTYIADERLVGAVNMKIMLSSDRFFYSCKEKITLINQDLKPSKYLLNDIFTKPHVSV